LGKNIIFCTGDKLGSGEEELGKVLMHNFIFSIAEKEPPPDIVIFMNRGVFLALEGSEISQSLEKLSASGTEILACGTCLDYYGLKEKPLLAKISNMTTITDLLAKAKQVVTI